jgi:peptidoglycan/LPS O-acetylase OafA/YrhL
MPNMSAPQVTTDTPADAESPLDQRAADLHLRTRAGREEIPSLHGLRGVAILLVLVSHTSETLKLHPGPLRSLFEIIPTGAFGVNVFFVMSGFLITRIVLSYSEHNRSLKTFYARRALRLLPALWFFVAVTVALGALGVFSVPALAALSALFFIWDYSPAGLGVWWLGHTWSLSIEEQFYILWAPFLMKAGRRRGIQMATGLIVVIPVARLVAYVASNSPTSYLRIRGDSMLHTRGDVLMVGCLIALLWESDGMQRLIERFARRPLLVSALLYLLASAYLINHYHGKWSQTVGNSADAFAIAFVMVYAIVHCDGAMGRVLNSRWMVQVGLMSYSLYLWQQLFLTTLNHSVVGRFPLNIMCTVACATVSYYLIEIPFLNVRRRVTSG